MNVVEAEGRTIEEAVVAALQQLGVERDQAEIEVLSQSTKGFLGIGGKKARVRASLRTPVRVDAPEDTPEPPPARPSARKREPAREQTRPSLPRAEQPAEQPQDESARSAKPAPPPELVERGCQVLGEILEHMDLEAPISSIVQDNEVIINLEDVSDGLLIGRKGETLDALEYLLNRIVIRSDEVEAHLLVDAAGYRQRRRQNLESLALRLSEQAKRRRKTVTLSPLNPRDRRIVHLTLEDDPLVTTTSMGRGYFRRLNIIPEGGGRRERSERGRETHRAAAAE